MVVTCFVCEIKVDRYSNKVICCECKCVNVGVDEFVKMNSAGLAKKWSCIDCVNLTSNLVSVDSGDGVLEDGQHDDEEVGDFGGDHSPAADPLLWQRALVKSVEELKCMMGDHVRRSAGLKATCKCCSVVAELRTETAALRDLVQQQSIIINNLSERMSEQISDLKKVVDHNTLNTAVVKSDTNLVDNDPKVMHKPSRTHKVTHRNGQCSGNIPSIVP